MMIDRDWMIRKNKPSTTKDTKEHGVGSDQFPRSTTSLSAPEVWLGMSEIIDAIKRQKQNGESATRRSKFSG
jgi:hypothetical protein